MNPFKKGICPQRFQTPTRLKAAESSVGFSGGGGKTITVAGDLWDGRTGRFLSYRWSECIAYLHQSQLPGQARNTRSEV